MNYKFWKSRCSGKYLDLRDEISGQFNVLNNEELHCLYRSPNIVLVLKSRRL
jgi:hypothetical protein